MISNLLLIYITIIAICETIAQNCLKEYSQSNKNIYFYVGILFYTIIGWLIYKTYDQKKEFGIINLIWSGLSIIISTSVGILLFKEKFHIHDILATLLITTGILILKFTN